MHVPACRRDLLLAVGIFELSTQIQSPPSLSQSQKLYHLESPIAPLTMNLFSSALFLLLSAGAVNSAFVPNSQRNGFVSFALNAKKVFIDGEARTTGLQVRSRLEKRKDLEIISAPDDLRKDEETRKNLINEADAVILCKC